MCLRAILIIPLLLLSLLSLCAQDTHVIMEHFDWSIKETKGSKHRLYNKKIIYSSKDSKTPFFHLRYEIAGTGTIRTHIKEVEYINAELIEGFEFLDMGDLKNIGDKLIFDHRINQNKTDFFAQCSFAPWIMKDGKLKLVRSIHVEFELIPSSTTTVRGPETNLSVLNSGRIFKLEIDKTGVYKLTGAYLEELGIDLNSLDVDKIQVFTNPGGKLPWLNKAERPDDLIEKACYHVGTSDGKMQATDAIYFYAEGAEKWENIDNQSFLSYNDNPYETSNYAFLRLDAQTRKKLQQEETEDLPLEEVNQFIKAQRYEKNESNLLHSNFSTQGTGLNWYGEFFQEKEVQDFSSKFDFSEPVQGKEGNLSVRFAGRSGQTTKLKVTINNQSFTEKISSSFLTNVQGAYAKIGKLDANFLVDQTNLGLILDYSGRKGGKGWLDYIELQYWKKLRANSDWIWFSNKSCSDAASFKFKLDDLNKDHIILNITDPYHTIEIKPNLKSDYGYFNAENSSFQEYVVFNTKSSLLKPKSAKSIANQNIHGIEKLDFAIIASAALASEAERLGAHRAEHDGYTYRVIIVDELFNEFSSGRREPTAIRDFLRMVANRDADFKYALLFGNGSFDYRGILFDREKYNHVPVFETRSSLNPLYSAPSDDFYGLLSPQEGNNLIGEVDLAIGRIPVNTPEQAKVLVDKIIRYDTSPDVLGPWNLKSVFIADDEDSNTHIDDAEIVSESFLSKNPLMNIDKIYFDSYKQVSTPGGERFPEAKQAINEAMFQGAQTICYLGHGGPSGWAQERVLQINDIDNWKNKKGYPLFITATCTFATYDDPSKFSAGEKVLVSPHGGIALFTTSRGVFASDNSRLTKSVFKELLQDFGEPQLGLGEILRIAKNSEQKDTLNINARKFLLLGDPSMKLNTPKYNVVTSKINGVDLSNAVFTDTIKALGSMEIEGYIADKDSLLVQDFNGKINIQVFDKRSTRKTLAQDVGSNELSFKVQNNVLFKGNASVKAGRFKISFKIPKEILFEVGQGKISYYAKDGLQTAAGSYSDFKVGGSTKIIDSDNTPPVVQVYINNEYFKNGGLTNNAPILFAKLSDDTGINISGSSIGHDIIAILDEDPKQSFILNDFYQSTLDDTRSGTLRFPFQNLSEGKHKITLRAWDLNNNVGEGSIEFVVSNNPETTLDGVLNYPNPFSDETYFHFEHNFNQGELDIRVKIYSVSGQLLKTIQKSVWTDGALVHDIYWDGRTDSGAIIGAGIYLYNIEARSKSSNLTKVSAFKKLVKVK